MAVDTLFQPVSGAGSASSGDYVKDHFLDTSRPANNNTSLTSTTLTNPLQFNLNNTDTPTYGVKTLFIKDATLIEDRNLWVSRKPTYEIQFTEYIPGVRAYAVGNIRVRNSTKGKVIELRSIHDQFGVTGVINQIAWNLSTSDQATATADNYTDGVGIGTFNFGNGSTDSTSQGVTKFNLYLHSATPSTSDIHTFLLDANQAGGTLAIEGVVCYFSPANIVCRPGSTYNDKNLIVTTTGATLPLATIAGSLGGRSVIYKNSTGSYVQATQEPANLSTIGQGSSGTNLISVSAGAGASFSSGNGIVVTNAGSSQYFGIVASVSTDTLTVGPTLAIGLSGTLYKVFSSGPTFAIGSTAYSVSRVLDFYELNNTVQTGNFGVTLSGDMYFADPTFKYYAWGKDLQFQTIDGYIGLGFRGNTNAFLQIDGNFSAVDIEYMSNGIFNATFSICGAPAWSQNVGSSGVFRQTIFTNAGVGNKNIVMVPGQSHTGVVITKINLYDMNFPTGLTAGLLSEYDSFMTKVNRNGTENATISQLGPMLRIYADQLNLQGGWTRGASSAFSGGVAYFGATANCVLNFQYFGKDFALLGTEGGSMTLTLDGASIGTGFNALKTVASMTWHSLALTYKAGATSVIQALTYERPTQGRLNSLQTKEPRVDLGRIPKNFIQSDTPRDAKDGDTWVQTKTNLINPTPTVWMRLFSIWNKIQISASSDDPNLTSFLSMGGRVTNNAGSVSTSVLFNGAFWGTVVNIPLALNQSGGSDGGYNFGVHFVDAVNAADTTVLAHYRHIGSSVATLTNRTTARNDAGFASYNGFLTVAKGSTDTSAANGSAGFDIWNGSSWSVSTAWTLARIIEGAFVTNGLLSSLGGIDNASSVTNSHEQKNTAFANSTNTVTPVNGVTRNACTIRPNLAILMNYATTGINVSNSYTWNGAAWSTAITSVLSIEAPSGDSAGIVGSALAVSAGGLNSGGSEIAICSIFNGAAFYSGASRPNSVAFGSGGSLGIS